MFDDVTRPIVLFAACTAMLAQLWKEFVRRGVVRLAEYSALTLDVQADELQHTNLTAVRPTS